jgi:hypothetical protein
MSKEIITISESEYIQHTQDSDGLCLACHEFTCGGVEPDATGYECESCGKKKVMGTEQALVMGLIEFGPED